MKSILIHSIIILLIAIGTSNGQQPCPHSKTVADKNFDTVSVREYFCDSLNIGRKSYDKIELEEYNLADSFWVEIKFYSRSPAGKWRLKNKYSYIKDGISGCDPLIKDYNHDGFNDMIYRSAIAARGANVVQRLFIYDRAKDELISLVNSEDYPNMRYNKWLDCIDAWLVYGGSSTVFLHVYKDSLKEFASVDLDDNINVSVIDKNGKSKYLIKDKPNTLGAFVRFKNFNPLEEYTDKDFVDW